MVSRILGSLSLSLSLCNSLLTIIFPIRQFCVLFQALARQAAELLLFFSSTSIGGLALTQGQMGIFLSARPLVSCVLGLTLMPRVFQRYGTERVFRRLVWVPCGSILLYIVLAGLSARRDEAHPLPGWLVSTLLFLQLIAQIGENGIYLATEIILPTRSPDLESLSQVNALCTIIAQIGQGTGAMLGSSLFARSVTIEHPALKGTLVWLVLLVFTLATAGISQKLTKVDGWKEKQLEDCNSAQM